MNNLYYSTSKKHITIKQVNQISDLTLLKLEGKLGIPSDLEERLSNTDKQSLNKKKINQISEAFTIDKILELLYAYKSYLPSGYADIAKHISDYNCDAGKELFKSQMSIKLREQAKNDKNINDIELCDTLFNLLLNVLDKVPLREI